MAGGVLLKTSPFFPLLRTRKTKYKKGIKPSRRDHATNNKSCYVLGRENAGVGGGLLGYVEVDMVFKVYTR